MAGDWRFVRDGGGCKRKINHLQAHTGASGLGEVSAEALTMVGNVCDVRGCLSTENRVSSGCRSRRKNTRPESCMESHSKSLPSWSMERTGLFQASGYNNLFIREGCGA